MTLRLITRTALVLLVCALAPLAQAPALAAGEAQPFVTAAELDLTRLLAPPPATDSAEVRAELAQLLAFQVTRSPADEARAQADAEETVWRFADALGHALDPAALPKTAALFARVAASEAAVVDPAKEQWARPRPHLVSDLIRPCVKRSSSGSYPSGHATFGTLSGIVLANMVPERRAAIMTRAGDYARQRLVAGIHYPSDVEGGRIAGSVIAAALLARPEFQEAFVQAQAELRAYLGL